MEEDLARKKRRQEIEEEKRRVLEREREKKEMEEWEERMRGGGGGSGSRMTGLGLIREGVEETGNGSGMDVDEFRHVSKVLEARDRARAEGGLGMGLVSEGLRRMTLDEQRKRGEAEEKRKEEMERVKKEQEEKERKKKEEKRRKEEQKMKKEEEEQQKLSRMTKEVQVQTATDLLKDMVANDWEEEVRLGGPAMADVAKVAGARKVSEARLRFEMASRTGNVSGSSSMPLQPSQNQSAGVGEARRVVSGQQQLQRRGDETDPDMSSAVPRGNPATSRNVSGTSVAQQRLQPTGGTGASVYLQGTPRPDDLPDFDRTQMTVIPCWREQPGPDMNNPIVRSAMPVANIARPMNRIVSGGSVDRTRTRPSAGGAYEDVDDDAANREGRGG